MGNFKRFRKKISLSRFSGPLNTNKYYFHIKLCFKSFVISHNQLSFDGFDSLKNNRNYYQNSCTTQCKRLNIRKSPRNFRKNRDYAQKDCSGLSPGMKPPYFCISSDIFFGLKITAV